MVQIMDECKDLEEKQTERESNLKSFDDQKLEITDEIYLAVLSEQLSEIGSELDKQRELMEDEREAALKNLGRVEILESLKRRNTCYCGHDLNQDAIALIDSVIKGLEKARTYGSSIGQISYVMSPVLYADKVKNLSSSALEKLAKLGELESEIFAKKSNFTEMKSIIANKTKRINEDARELAPVIAADLEEINQEISDHDRTVVYYNGQLEQVNESIGKIKKKIRTLEHTTPQQNFFESAVKLAENARDAFIDIVSWMSADKREEIQNLATDVHHSITNKPDVWKGIVIHDDFRMDIIDRHGKPVPKKELSEGEKQVLAFSFISALAHAAKSDTPIVMDSPIIRLDKEHRVNILDYLPNLASQVALLMLPDIEMREDYYNLPSLKRHLGMLVEIKYNHKLERSTFEVIKIGNADTS
jgi:DNA sulfur modification protein DndD